MCPRPSAVNLSEWYNIIGKWVAIILTLYALYVSVFGVVRTTFVHRSLFLSMSLVIYFLVLKTLGGGKSLLPRVIDGLLAIASVLFAVYVFVNYGQILGAIGATYLTKIDLAMGSVLLILVLESIRRESKPFFVLTILGIAYVIFGPYFPGILKHPGMNWQRLIYISSFSMDGIMGTALAVASTYLFLFMFFGVVLEKTGTGGMFINMAQSIFGRYTGGSAKTAVVASGLVGSIVGSSIANSASIGSLTIPLMKKTGYQPHVAAAIEAMASEGGQLMPPVLGAAAFIMAEISGIPYSRIALASLIPALLYYLSLMFVVDFEARKYNLKGLPKEELPNFFKALKEKGHLLISIVLLVYLIMVKNYTPSKAGVIVITVALALAMLRQSTRLTFKDFVALLEDGGKGAVSVVVLCAGIGIVIQAVVVTGLGMRLTEIIVGLAGGNVLAILFLTMIIAIVLGMGMPTPVAYMLLAVFAVPPMVEVGIPKLAAHLFAFFFAIKSGSTPPVALVAVVTAGIAGANWLKTAWHAFLYSIPGWIIAYQYVFSPALLMDGPWHEVVLTSSFAAIGVVSFTAAIQGWFIKRANVLERVLLFMSGLVLVDPNQWTSVIGLLGLVVVGLLQKFWPRKEVSVGGIKEVRA